MSLIGRTYESSNSPSGITASILRKHEASQGSPLGFLLTYSFRDPGIGPNGYGVCFVSQVHCVSGADPKIYPFPHPLGGYTAKQKY